LEEVHVPVGLFRDGKKRKRRAAARARAAAAGGFPDTQQVRPDPLVTTANFVAARPGRDASAHDSEDPFNTHAVDERC
jgi:hypothetical protein